MINTRPKGGGEVMIAEQDSFHWNIVALSLQYFIYEFTNDDKVTIECLGKK